MIQTKTFIITTHGGRTNQWIDCGLGWHDDALNFIGYTGMHNKVKMTRQEYLDKYVNTDNMNYTITQTKSDSGDYYEQFMVTLATTNSEIVKEPEQPRIGLFADMFINPTL